MSAAVDAVQSPASFRDPSGFIFKRDGVVYRQVNASYREDYDLLMSSGLYEALVKDGLLLRHEEVAPSTALSGDAYKVLRPVQLPFISYPYEWCFSQLRDAALTTLAVQRRALEKGMSLKDASSYNLQLVGGRSCFIDSLSFERYVEGKPWVAYKQFCQHFLAPLALMSKTEARLNQLLRVYIDGVPLDLASRLLPWSSVFSFSLGVHIHAHAKSQKKHAGQAAAPKPAAGPSKLRFSKQAFTGLIDSLESAVSGLTMKGGDFEWEDYYAANNNYGEAGLKEKREALAGLIGKLAPKMVWDLGANTGVFSRLAVEKGAKLAVAWDIDPGCVEAGYRHVVDKRDPAIVPLLLDLTNPSPGLGWANQERMSLAERGPADLVLALGLVHHLAISNNVPLPRVADFLAGLTKHLIIEWVPKEDSQVQKLLATRPDVFPGYVQPELERAFATRFVIEDVVPIPGTVRTLYSMRVRA